MALTQDQERRALASWMPPGMAWAAFRITDTNAWRFLNGLAPEFVRLATFIREARVTIPKITNNDDFIDEWEVAMAIPDDCFPGTGTLVERWTHVLAKFALMNVQSSADFVALAAVLGFTVTVEGGIGSVLFPGTISDPKEARNTIVVTFDVEEPNAFPFTFPITFEQNQTQVVECAFETLRPAHNQLRFLYI